MAESAPSSAADRHRFRRMLQPFRFLAIVYGLALAAACWEYAHRQPKVDLYLDPQANFTETLYELYPQRGEARYERAVQTLLCLQAQTAQRPTPPACRQYESKDLRREIRRQFEQALETKIKSEEGLYYHYLQILAGSQAPKRKIDAAYLEWRRNFPLSRLPDPRGAASSK